MSATHEPPITYRPPEWVTHATLFNEFAFDGQKITLDQSNTDYPLFAKSVHELDIVSSHGFAGESKRKFQTAPRRERSRIPPLEGPRTWNSVTFKLGTFKPFTTQAESSIIDHDGAISLTRRGKDGGKTWKVGSYMGTIVGGTSIRDGQIEEVSADSTWKQFRVDMSLRLSGSYAEGGTDSVQDMKIDPESPERWYTRPHAEGNFDWDPNLVNDDRDLVDGDEEMRTMVHELVGTSILD